MSWKDTLKRPLTEKQQGIIDDVLRRNPGLNISGIMRADGIRDNRRLSQKVVKDYLRKNPNIDEIRKPVRPGYLQEEITYRMR